MNDGSHTSGTAEINPILTSHSEGVHAITPTMFAPFSDAFYCTHCGYADTGQFCSSCGRSLSFDQAQLWDVLIARFKALGFSCLADAQQEQQEHASLRALDFTPLTQDGIHAFYDLGVGIFGIEPSMRLDLLLLVREDQLKKEIGSVISDFLRHCIDENRLDEFRKLKKREKIRYISIKLVVLGAAEPNPLAQNWQLTDVVPKRSTLPKFRRSMHFVIASATSSIFISLDKNKVLTTRQFRLDPINHQVSLALQQQAGNVAPEKRPSIIRAVIGDILDYFVAFAELLSSPSSVAQAMTQSDYFPVAKIWSFYVIGVLLPAVVIYVFSLGQADPNDLLIFSGLPPILGDLAEGAVRAVFLGAQAAIFYMTFRLFRKQGSFKKLFLSMLFVGAFWDVISTLVTFIAQFIVIDLMSQSYEDYLRLTTQINGALWILYLYMAYPFFVKLFRVGLGAIVVAGTAYFFVIGLPMLILSLFLQST